MPEKAAFLSGKPENPAKRIEVNDFAGKSGKKCRLNENAGKSGKIIYFAGKSGILN